MRFAPGGTRWSRRVLIALAAILALGAALAIPSFRGTEPIRIGFVGTLSVAKGETGLQCADGALLATEDCNASGGIRGTPVRLETQDDQAEASAAGKIVETFATQGCWAIVGPTESRCAASAALAAGKGQMFLISPVVSTDIAKDGDGSFASVRVPLNFAAEYIARHVRFKRNLMRSALIIDKRSTHYFPGLESTVVRALTTAGVSLAGKFVVPTDDEQSYSQLAKRVLASGGDNVLVFAGAAETALLVQHLRVSGCELPVITYEPVSMRDLVVYGGLAAEGITVICSMDPGSDSSRYRGFCDRFERRFGRAPDVAAAHSYEATRVALLSISHAMQRDGVRHAMLSRQWFDGLQGRISMGSSGSPRRELRVLQLRNGVFTDFD